MWKARHIDIVDLAKLNWRLIRDKHNLCAKTLQKKYVNQSSSVSSRNCTLKKGKGSINLRVVSVGNDLVNSSIWWIPWDANTIRFWLDNLIG